MSKTSKNYIWIVVAIIIIGGGILLFSKQKNDIESDVVSNSNLYPEQAITHGHGLAVDVADPNKLWIATHNGLLLLENETDLYRVGKSKDDYMGFSAHPTDSQVFFTSGHPSFGDNLGFQKSVDAGITWKKVSNGSNGPVDFHAMAISSANPDIIYGWYAGDLQRSIDQGKTWEIINRGIVAIYLAADTEDENIVYAATPEGQGVMVSKDKGMSWKTFSPELEGGAVSVVVVHPNDSNTLITFSERLGGLGKSIDGGKTWQKVNENFNRETILHLAFDKNNPDVIYALTHQTALYKSSDTGEIWNKVR